jgi:molybdenum cofactor biosynthesis enzyme MoaA
MKLQNIGFYTLSDGRAKQTSVNSPLWRAELLLNEACNFKCPYCRGIRSDCAGDVPLEEARGCLSLWLEQGLKNVRFSGGEPTLYKGLLELVTMAKEGGVEHIAISTNGSASQSLYKRLFEAGVNDFSVSLDGCCASVGDRMAGDIPGVWEMVVENIKYLSKLTYVTVGMVFTEDNVGDCKSSILFADSLGVSDIRVIPSAQYNKALEQIKTLPDGFIEKYPILKYRVNNTREDIHVRGNTSCAKCYLALDDMAVAGGRNGLKHFPCIIYLREGGNPIGDLAGSVRTDRAEWVENHNVLEDPICKGNCLDVCVEYNKKVGCFRNVD